MTVFKITPATVLTSQEKTAFYEHCTKGKTPGYIARFNEAFFDTRTFAITHPVTGQVIPGNGDLLSILSQTGTFGLTQEISDKFDQMGLDTSRVFRRETATTKGAPGKATKRLIQFAKEICSAKPDFKKIDTTLAIVLFALREANGMPITAKAIEYLGAADNRAIAEKSSPNTRGVSRASISARIGLVHQNTISTQISRSIGVQGFALMVGAVNVFGAGKNDRTYTLNPDNNLTKAFFALLDGATESQLDELFAAKDTNE